MYITASKMVEGKSKSNIKKLPIRYPEVVYTRSVWSVHILKQKYSNQYTRNRVVVSGHAPPQARRMASFSSSIIVLHLFASSAVVQNWAQDISYECKIPRLNGLWHIVLYKALCVQTYIFVSYTDALNCFLWSHLYLERLSYIIKNFVKKYTIINIISLWLVSIFFFIFSWYNLCS